MRLQISHTHTFSKPNPFFSWKHTCSHSYTPNIHSIIYRAFFTALEYKRFFSFAHNSFGGFTILSCDALDHIFDHDTGEKERETRKRTVKIRKVKDGLED